MGADIKRISPALGLRLLFVLVFIWVGAQGNYLSIWLDDVGWSKTSIGWLGGIHLGSLVVLPLVWGHLVDRSGRPVRMLRVLSLGAAIGFVPFVLTTALWPLLAAMLAHAVFRVGTIPTLDALTLTHVETHGGDYGRVRIFGSWGFIAGGFLMGLLVDATSRAAVPIFLVAVLFVTVGVALAMPERPQPPAERRPLAATVRRLLARSDLRRFYLVTFAYRVAAQGLYYFLPLHILDLGVSDAVLPVYWTLGVLSEIVLIRNAPRLFGARDPRRVLATTVACAAIQNLAIALITEPYLMLPFMVLHGMAFGIWYYTSVTWLGARVEASERATAQALFAAVGFGLGGSVSAIAAGYLFEAGRGPLLFAVAAAGALLVSGLALLVLER